MIILFLIFFYVTIFSLIIAILYRTKAKNFFISNPLFYYSSLRGIHASSLSSISWLLNYLFTRWFMYRKFENFSTTNWYLFLNKLNKFDSLISKKK